MNLRRHAILKVAAIATFALVAFSATSAGACDPVTNLGASPSCSGVKLTWTASLTPNVTYTINRGTDVNGNPVDVITLATGVTGTTYTDTTTSLSTKYFYQILTVESGGANSGSNSPGIWVTTPSAGSCGSPTPIGAIGAIPVALLLGGVLIYQQHRRSVRRAAATAAS